MQHRSLLGLLTVGVLLAACGQTPAPATADQPGTAPSAGTGTALQPQRASESFPSDCWSYYQVSGSYSPSNGCAYVQVWTDRDFSPGSPVWIQPTSDFQFQQNDVAGIRSMYETERHYFTIDFATDDHNTTIDAQQIYTNLPSAKLDFDDDLDFWGNGYRDEAEATVLNPYQLYPNVNYYFDVQFQDMTWSGHAGSVQLNAARSYVGLPR